jgi:type I restriction enzyme M protein
MKGDMYEYLLNQIAASGTNGQFRTPRHFIDLIVALIDPQPNETMVDPACGAPRGAIRQYLKGKEVNGKVSSMPQYC